MFRAKRRLGSGGLVRPNVNSRVAPSFFIERREACSSLFEEAYVCSSTETDHARRIYYNPMSPNARSGRQDLTLYASGYSAVDDDVALVRRRLQPIIMIYLVS
jgi:hypothetical protein